MIKHGKYFLLLSICFFITSAFANITVPIYLTEKKGFGKEIGNVVISPARNGVLFTPDLKNLPPGTHGFHVHENPSCNRFGMAAGPHFDPKMTDSHQGPHGHGHEGDLPRLLVNSDGDATKPVFAPHLKMFQLSGHSLIIHKMGDNYSNRPENGGGGARIACGIIK